MKRLLVVICLFFGIPGTLLAQTATDAVTKSDAQSDKGMAAYDRGDYENAVAIWKKLADAGNAVAQFNVGNMYLKGLGVARDPKQAAHFYELAASQGHGVSQYNLAVMYAGGAGVTRDYQRAMNWIDKALANMTDEDGRQLAQQARSFIAARLAEESAVTAAKPPTATTTTAAAEQPAEPMPATPAAPADAATQSQTPATEADTGETGTPSEQQQTSAGAQPTSSQEPAYTETWEAKPGAQVADSDQGYTVQLASYRHEDNAAEGWRRLSKEHPDLLAGLDHTVESAVLDDGTTIYRLRVGRFSGFSAANTLCTDLKAAGTDCLVVRVE